MKILLVGNSFNKSIGQGVDKYCGYLLEGLSESGKVKKVELKRSKNPLRTILINIFGSFFKTFGKKAEVYHFTILDISFPVLFKSPSIITVYDLIPLILKKERKKLFNYYFKFMCFFVRRANHIISISESTKKDLIKYLKIPEKKISVIYPGVDHKVFFPLKQRKNGNFIVGFLGGLVNRKNPKILLKIAELVKNEKIIFKIGGKGKELKELKEIQERRGLKNIQFVGFVPENKLNKFYNSLDLFISPTIYDGFCMPGLEAMACGIPIITSNTSALPEVSGNAGITVDPKDAKKIAKILLKLKQDPFLRKKMGKESLEHSKQFSWKKCVKETLNVYKRVNYSFKKINKNDLKNT